MLWRGCSGVAARHPHVHNCHVGRYGGWVRTTFPSSSCAWCFTPTTSSCGCTDLPLWVGLTCRTSRGLFCKRTSRQAARTVGVTPPDVDSDEVLRFVLPDLVVGMTEGWLVYDPDGKLVRVLADVSFFVGDYVQEAKSCRLMGHAALTPCTLCAYRAPGVAGSNYGKLGSSEDVGLMRTSARSVAVGRAARAAGVSSTPADPATMDSND